MDKKQMGALQLHVNNCSSFVSEKRKSKNVPIALSRCNWSCFSGWHQCEVFVVVAAVICVVSASLSTSENIKTHTRHQSLWNGDSSLWKHTHTHTHTLTHAHTRSALKWRSSHTVSRTGGTKYLFSLPWSALFHNGHIYNNLHECDLCAKKHACIVSLFLNL